MEVYVTDKHRIEYYEAEQFSKDKGLFLLDPDSYKPIRKRKEFNPNPLVSSDHKRQRIPHWADGVNNPECIGSDAYWSFWNEQIDRCLYGYETGGIWIPGRYYYYLNFTKISGVLGVQFPWFIDIDLEYFRTVEFIKDRAKLGMVSIKARRKGLSEKGQTILNYGLRFIPKYKGGVAAGDDKYVQGFKKKFRDANVEVVDDMKLHVLQNNEDRYYAGYEVKNRLGQFEEDGFKGEIRFASMYDKDTKLEGEYFNDVILEESGQFPKLGGAIESIKPALMMGGYVGGQFYIYGTGGNVLSSSRDFMEYFYDAEKLGFVPFWVSAKRMLFPFLGNPFSTRARVDPEDSDAPEEDGMKLFEDEGWSDWEFLGCENVWGAENWVLKTREKYSKVKNKKKLIKHNQSFPLSVEEAFTSNGVNNFDAEVLYEQLHNIFKADVGLVKEYVLEYVKTEVNGIPQLKYPLEVQARPAKKTDPDWMRVQILEKPQPHKRDFDVGGVDSYNQDDSNTSKSQGAMAVLRRYNQSPKGSDNGIKPVCIYYNRPPRKEQFFDICLKISIYYNLVMNTMLSAEADLIIDYYLKNHGAKYVALRPKSFDAPTAKPTNKFGVKMTEHSKPLMLGMLQSFYLDNAKFIWFEDIIRDALAYDEENIGTDWDLTDAIGYAMMRIIDMKRGIRDSSAQEEDKRYFNDLPTGDNLNEYLDYHNRISKNENSNDMKYTDEIGGWV